MEGTSSTGRKSEFSQKGEFADALRWERFTDLKVRVGEAILNFLLQSGKDTGGEMFLDERAEKWKETKTSKAEFRRFADTWGIDEVRSRTQRLHGVSRDDT